MRFKTFFFFILGEAEIQYTNDILAMVSPEGEKVSLGKVTFLLHVLLLSCNLPFIVTLNMFELILLFPVAMV